MQLDSLSHGLYGMLASNRAMKGSLNVRYQPQIVANVESRLENLNVDGRVFISVKWAEF